MVKNIGIKPEVSVIMSVYNGADYIDAAIKSILSQTFKNFEFIIVNDGSTDDSLARIKSYNDKRITLIDQDNMGLVLSLNRAIDISKAKIIARQDADDLSEKDRLEKEFKILNESPEVVLLGSSITTIDESSKIMNVHKVLLNDAELKQELLFRSPFAHGSVMFRKTTFISSGGYIESDWPAEDYGLWLRMSKYGKFINIDSPLYKYRENTSGISAKNQNSQIRAKERIQNTAWMQRKKLINNLIHTNNYLNLEMGEFRIERITSNLLDSLGKSFSTLKLLTSCKIVKIIVMDKNLFRKSTRILLSKLK